MITMYRVKVNGQYIANNKIQEKLHKLLTDYKLNGKIFITEDVAHDYMKELDIKDYELEEF